jgi:hypothetical protein
MLMTRANLGPLSIDSHQRALSALCSCLYRSSRGTAHISSYSFISPGRPDPFGPGVARDSRNGTELLVCSLHPPHRRPDLGDSAAIYDPARFYALCQLSLNPHLLAAPPSPSPSWIASRTRHNGSTSRCHLDSGITSRVRASRAACPGGVGRASHGAAEQCQGSASSTPISGLCSSRPRC